MPAISPSAFARIVARTRTVKRLPRLFIQPAIVETLHVGENVTRQLPAVCLLRAQGLTQYGCQLFQHRSLGDPDNLPVPEYRRTRNEDGFDSRDLAAMHHGIDHRDRRIQVRIGEMVPWHEDQIRRLPWLQGANQISETCRLGAIFRRHLQNLGRGWYPVVHARLAMQPQDQAHLLQHVTIVVDPSLI